MRSGIVTRLHKNFEDYVHVQDDVEFWFARDLQNLLGYTEWRNFLKVVEKARESCKTSNHGILDHFVDVNKSIPVPKGGAREIGDIMLTRYACYLIAQNGDPRKEEIAFAQSYFAVQTRKQEIIEEHIRLSLRLKARKQLKDSEAELSRNIYERGVDESGFARIRSKGDMALFVSLLPHTISQTSPGTQTVTRSPPPQTHTPSPGTAPPYRSPSGDLPLPAKPSGVGQAGSRSEPYTKSPEKNATSDLHVLILSGLSKKERGFNRSRSSTSSTTGPSSRSPS